MLTVKEALARFGRAIEPIGGRWWRCLLCRDTIPADCECCEPHAHRCGTAPAGK